METGGVVKRQKVEHSAATALHTSLSDLDPPHSLAQEFRQAVQDVMPQHKAWQLRMSSRARQQRLCCSACCKSLKARQVLF